MKIWLASLEQQAGGMSAVSLGVGPQGSRGVGGWPWRTQLSFQVEKGQAGIAAECQQAAVVQGFLHAFSLPPQPSSPGCPEDATVALLLADPSTQQRLSANRLLAWALGDSGGCGNYVLDSSLSTALFPAPLHGCGSEAFFFLHFLLRGSNKTRMWAGSSAPAAGQGTGLEPGLRCERVCFFFFSFFEEAHK